MLESIYESPNQELMPTVSNSVYMPTKQITFKMFSWTGLCVAGVIDRVDIWRHLVAKTSTRTTVSYVN